MSSWDQNSYSWDTIAHCVQSSKLDISAILWRSKPVLISLPRTCQKPKCSFVFSPITVCSSVVVDNLSQPFLVSFVSNSMKASHTPLDLERPNLARFPEWVFIWVPVLLALRISNWKRDGALTYLPGLVLECLHQERHLKGSLCSLWVGLPGHISSSTALLHDTVSVNLKTSARVTSLLILLLESVYEHVIGGLALTLAITFWFYPFPEDSFLLGLNFSGNLVWSLFLD